MIFYLILTYFALRSAHLLYRGEPVRVLGINLTSASFDSGTESAPYMLTLADNAGSPNPSQVDYNNGTNQWSEPGSWTMGLEGGSTAGDYSVSEYLDSWKYIKYGDMYVVWGRGSVTVNTHGSGTPRVTGLPAALASGHTANGHLRLIGISESEDMSNMWITAIENQTSVAIGATNQDGTETSIDVSQFATGDIIQITYIYTS